MGCVPQRCTRSRQHFMNDGTVQPVSAAVLPITGAMQTRKRVNAVPTVGVVLVVVVVAAAPAIRSNSSVLAIVIVSQPCDAAAQC